MKTNVTFNQIATELVNIFSNEARVAEYNAQGPETTKADQQPTQGAQKAESEPAELFTVNGETFRKGDRVTVETVDAYDAHHTTEAGTLTGYASAQALAEVATDDGQKVYGHFATVKHSPTDPTNGKANTTEAATSGENVPAEGLELVEIAGGVAVVGDSRTTYRNRKAIKAHGCKWNKDAQQWEATDPEAVANVREWFGVAQDEQPEPTTEANDTTAAPADNATAAADDAAEFCPLTGQYLTPSEHLTPAEIRALVEAERERLANNTTTTAAEAAQAPETTAADQQPTDGENGAQSTQNEPEEFRTVEFYNREGVTDEHGRHVKTADEIKRQAARIECNYIACRDGLRGIARRLERTKGAQHPDTLAAYERLQSRAAWLRRAELAAHAEAGRKHRAAYIRGTDPTPGGKWAEGIQSQTEGTNPVIEASEIDGFSKTENRAADSREVTNPIKADDLNTPRVLQLSERRDIVTGCTPEQADELERMGGKPTAAGVVFRASKANRDRLHIWQNEQSRKERAAILGEGWQYIEGLNTGTEPGDVVTCIDGTRGRVTKSAPESCCIEFETEGGQRLSVAGYFRKESPRYRAAEKSPISEKQETGTIDTPTTDDALEIKTGDLVLSKHYGAMGTVLGREYDHRRQTWYYRVEFDTPQKGMDGTEYKVTEFQREGITKNYNPQGTAEIVGNAIYYAEELQAGFWGTDSTPRTIFGCEIFKPTDRRPSWLLVTDIFSSPKEMTLQQVADYLAARYQETHKPMLQDSEEIKADVFRNGLTEEQSGKLTAKLSQWARMTDENNHTEARVSIAKFFGLTFQTDFKELQEKSYKQGYLTMSDRETSCQLTTRMLGAIERNYSQGIADRVRNCL